MTEKKWTDCMAPDCGKPGRPHVCPGDQRYHHHGAIHTAPGSDVEGELWGWLCDNHFAVADREWSRLRRKSIR